MENCKDLSGRVAVVTGGTAGIGLATCIAFAKLGCKVAFTGRYAEKGSKALEKIREEAGCGADVVVFIQGDVSEEKNVVEMFQKVVECFGRVDLLINNAAIIEWLPVTETESQVFDRIMKVNVYGTFYCMKHGIKQMKSQDPPEKGVYSIVNISSRVGVGVTTLSGAYSVSKHAVVGMTRAAAKEVASSGIRVNSVCPGVVETEMVEWMDESHTPKLYESQVIGRKGTPEEVAAAVVFACTTPFMMGHQLVLDGGATGY